MRQCGEDVLRMLVTGGPPVCGGGGIPDQFTLIVVPKKKIYSCNVMWRIGRRIGVAFRQGVARTE
jgi:hypothetical protein